MNAQTVLEFMEEVGKLKVLPRTGWLLRGLQADAESIAEHCFRMSLLSMVIADLLVQEGQTVNVEKVMRIALLHDVAEAKISDIPYPAMAYIPEDVKEAGEREAIRDMTRGFGALGETYTALWREFEESSTLEGRIVRAADKLELMIQAYEYQKIGYQSLGDFWTNMANFKGFAEHPIMQQIMDLLVERRQQLSSNSK
ncbi:MAG: HD domain-containing protein [Anaerolineales bacterium]|nr:HD domain-containing protein [Anaerolineales bacterium]